MSYKHIKLPESGDKIIIKNNSLQVSDNPILGYVEGDGIGPDITKASLRVWEAAVERAYGGKRKIHWAELFMGEKAAGVYDGDYFPAETREALKDLVVSIKGPLTTPVGGGFRSLNVSLRQDLDLYACVRPVRYYDGVPSPLRHPEEVDVVIFRENTEDVYAGIEYAAGTDDNEKLANFLREEMGCEFFEGAGLGIKPVSAFGSKRLIRKAIRYAIDNGKASVTLVHKGNIMKFTEGAFRNWGYEVAAEEFADETITESDVWDKHDGEAPAGKVIIKDRIADIMFQLLQLRPGEFDVLATTNLNGDYLSDSARRRGGWGRYRARGQHGRSRRGIRGDPRHRAKIRKPEQGQSFVVVVVGGDDAGVHRLDRSGHAHQRRLSDRHLGQDGYLRFCPADGRRH